MRIGIVVLAAISVLCACSSSSDPTPREPSATAAATTATPTAVAPSMPTQAREDSPEGAAAFVKHYIDVFNYAASTGDVAGLSRLSSPSCKGCQNYIDLYRDTYAAGGYFKGGNWEMGPLDLKYLPHATSVTTTVRYAQSRYRRSSTDPEKAGAAGRSTIVYTVSDAGKDRSITRIALGEKS